MSSDAKDEREQGDLTPVTDPRNPNEESEGQDPLLDVPISLDELAAHVANNHPEACEACKIYEIEANDLISQLTEKEQMNVTLIHSLKAKQAELESLKRENEVFIHGKHELNHLRGLVQSMMILGIPIKDHFGPDEIFMDKVKPSTIKLFNSPLQIIPPGTWGHMRSIQVESTESSEMTPQLVSSSNEDYYVVRDYANYRQELAHFLDNMKLFQCGACMRPLYKQQKWILCMRCLATPYCSTMCIHAHKPLHAIGCRIHHVWRADIEPSKPATTTESTSISTSSSSSEGKGSKAKGKGKGKGPQDQHSSRKRQRTCWHFTHRGSCNNGDECNDLHDAEARRRQLQKELQQLQPSSSSVLYQPAAYRNDADDAGDGNGNGTWQ